MLIFAYLLEGILRKSYEIQCHLLLVGHTLKQTYMSRRRVSVLVLGTFNLVTVPGPFSLSILTPEGVSILPTQDCSSSLWLNMKVFPDIKWTNTIQGCMGTISMSVSYGHR